MSFRHGEWFGLLPLDPLLGFDAQIQFQLPVDAIDALVVPAEVLDVAQVQEAEAKAPVAVVVGEAHQPVGDDLVFQRLAGLVAIAGFTDGKGLAGMP